MNKLKVMSGNNPAEIFQSLDIKFAFVNGKQEQVSLPIKCRDFLGDCIWSKLTGNKASIYSFNYNYKDTPYDTKVLRLSLKFPNKKDMEIFMSQLQWLWGKEDKAKVKRTAVFKTDQANTLVIEAAPQWQSAMWQ